MRWLIVFGLMVLVSILAYSRENTVKKLPQPSPSLNEFGRAPTSSPVLPDMSSEQTRLLMELPSSPSVVNLSPQGIP